MSLVHTPIYVKIPSPSKVQRWCTWWASNRPRASSPSRRERDENEDVEDDKTQFLHAPILFSRIIFYLPPLEPVIPQLSVSDYGGGPRVIDTCFYYEGRPPCFFFFLLRNNNDKCTSYSSVELTTLINGADNGGSLGRLRPVLRSHHTFAGSIAYYTLGTVGICFRIYLRFLGWTISSMGIPLFHIAQALWYNLFAAYIWYLILPQKNIPGHEG